MTVTVHARLSYSLTKSKIIYTLVDFKIWVSIDPTAPFKMNFVDFRAFEYPYINACRVNSNTLKIFPKELPRKWVRSSKCALSPTFDFVTWCDVTCSLRPPATAIFRPHYYWINYCAWITAKLAQTGVLTFSNVTALSDARCWADMSTRWARAGEAHQAQAFALARRALSQPDAAWRTVGRGRTVIF